MNKITPHLWFDNQAQEAAELYCSVFDGSKILDTSVYPEGSPSPGTVLSVRVNIAGQEAIFLNAGPQFKLDEAFSFFVDCEDQDEVDRYWNALTADGGEESMCGWLKDKYGVSWQIVPSVLEKLLTDSNSAKASAAMQSMLQMRKLDIAELQRAFDTA
ncbi:MULTISPECIES: VOC family protein [unclassified Cryobacterium]|uniref:VOC family protein n=1 Tax=unclassified Cryobacterium TaxID=2649013 RepID=UPI0014482738|nr:MULTISPECIES: VOC family protein [unclassified Cryobacterium]